MTEDQQTLDDRDLAAFWATAEKERASNPVAAPSTFFERGDDVELGQDMAGQLGQQGEVVYTEGKVWAFNGLTWDAIEDEALKKAAQAYAGMWCKQTRRGKTDTYRKMTLNSGAVSGIVAQAKIYLFEGKFFQKAPVGAAFASKFVRIDNGMVVAEPLTKDHRVKSDHAATYDLPDCADEPPRTMQFLRDLWAGQEDVEERIRYILEWMGAALLGISVQYKDTPLVVGEKDTGKSVLLSLIASLFPVMSHRSVPLHSMSNEYHRAWLSGGRINFVNELPSRELLDSESAKAILSGDVVNCRRPHENPFEWKPRCGHCFAANELPPSRDNALMERLVVLECLNVVPHELQDRTLPAQLAAEAPQLALLALLSAQNLLKRGYMVRPSSATETSAEWRLQSDPVWCWAKERLDVSGHESVTTGGKELYHDFERWASDNGHTKMSSTRFGVRLKALKLDWRKSNGIRYLVVLKRPEAPKPAYRGWADS